MPSCGGGAQCGEAILRVSCAVDVSRIMQTAALRQASSRIRQIAAASLLQPAHLNFPHLAILTCPPLLQNYLETKRDKMEHMLDGEWCYWNHDGEPREATGADKPQSGGIGLPGKATVTPQGVVVVPMSPASNASEVVTEVNSS